MGNCVSQEKKFLNVVFGRYLVERVVVVIIIPIQVILPVASIDGLRPGLVHLQQHSAFMSAFTSLFLQFWASFLPRAWSFLKPKQGVN